MFDKETVERVARAILAADQSENDYLIQAAIPEAYATLLATAALAAAWGWKPIAGPVDTSKAPWDGKFYLLYDSSCESEYMSDRWDEQYSRWDCAPESTPTHYCVPTAPEVKP